VLRVLRIENVSEIVGSDTRFGVEAQCGSIQIVSTLLLLFFFCCFVFAVVHASLYFPNEPKNVYLSLLRRFSHCGIPRLRTHASLQTLTQLTKKRIPSTDTLHATLGDAIAPVAPEPYAIATNRLYYITVVFPKEGQLAERYAKNHGLWLRQIGQPYALRFHNWFWSIGQRHALRRLDLFQRIAAQAQRYDVKISFTVSPLGAGQLTRAAYPSLSP
jgi:hypothetical protein